MGRDEEEEKQAEDEGRRGGRKRIPLATYRLQFNRQLTFKQASATAVYLRELGISDCYASPLFKAGPQSTHGYDICGFDEFNPSLGATGDFDRFTARLRELGLGLLLDMVPNHMGAHLSNAWWRDVLEKGPASAYATWFDIDWQRPQSGLRGKVLLPTLEAQYAEVLEAGKLRLVSEGNRLCLAYYDKRFPLSPRSQAILATQNSGPIFDSLNGRPGAPHSFDALDRLLQQQHYRLADWRVGAEETNYRRFFDIPELVSLRVELREVFEATHRLVLELIRAGKVSGLRIDHPDGLWNPKQYFDRIQLALVGEARSGKEGSEIMRKPAANARTPLYIVAEKILSGEEPLPSDWAVDGTTGYDFLNRVNGLFVNRANEGAFDQIYREFTGQQNDFHALVRASKRQVLETSFISELRALASRCKRIASHTRYGQDLTLRRLEAALVEIISAFPVYRTYVTQATNELPPAEKESVAQAIRLARAARPSTDASALGFLADLLLLSPPWDLEAAGRTECREIVMRFQQLTGPVMAKGLEDTAFYRFNRLISLNEVGGDPGTFGISLEDFHRHNLSKSRRWPHSLLATATHDTKRGEDNRARLNVLSEMPEAWRQAVANWSRANAGKKSVLNGQPAPDSNDEYLFYQALVGAWPPEADSAKGLGPLRERLAAYMLKAIREAKTHTSWTDPNPAYETATEHFVRNVLADSPANSFLENFKPFQRRVAFFGRFNSLSQTLLKLTSPGVPDLYQGTELWDLSLVDPDNRRPVDYEKRRRLLAQLKEQLGQPSSDPTTVLEELLDDEPSGRMKLYVIWRTLEFRQRHSALFEQGWYRPLAARGEKGDHVCAFARGLNDQIVIVIAPRLVVGATDGAERGPMGRAAWQDTCLATPEAKPGKYRNIFTGDVLTVRPGETGFGLAEALAKWPVALFTGGCP